MGHSWLTSHHAHKTASNPGLGKRSHLLRARFPSLRFQPSPSCHSLRCDLGCRFELFELWFLFQQFECEMLSTFASVGYAVCLSNESSQCSDRMLRSWLHPFTDSFASKCPISFGRRCGRPISVTSPQPFVAHGVTSVAQLVAATSTSQDLGVAKWQVEAILASTVKDETAPEPGRTDLPVAYSGRRANFGLAVAAGQPNSRKRSLDALDDDILARSTNPAHEARLRTYISLCVVWEVPPWPLTYENIRAFGASMKQGGYRSAGIYFQSICSHQQRVLRTPIPPMVRYCIRDCVRSIKRGLGVTRLKDGFPALGLSRIPVGDVNTGFILDSVEHSRDMAVLATWFMLREIENGSCSGLPSSS